MKTNCGLQNTTEQTILTPHNSLVKTLTVHPEGKSPQSTLSTDLSRVLSRQQATHDTITQTVNSSRYVKTCRQPRNTYLASSYSITVKDDLLREPTILILISLKAGCTNPHYNSKTLQNKMTLPHLSCRSLIDPKALDQCDGT